MTPFELSCLSRCGRSDKFFWAVKEVTVLNILQFSPDFVRENKFDSVISAEVHSFDDIFEVPFMRKPAQKNYILMIVLKIYTPNMMGRLAGKVRYPESIILYMGYASSSRLWCKMIWRKETAASWEL